MIPNKPNFKFNELTPITGVKPYVIRFWETEFTDIAPLTSDSGQKLYARKDVEAILKIKKLLFEEKLSIPEAKLKLHNEEVTLASTEPMSESKNDSSELKSILLFALQSVRAIKAKRNW